MLDLLGAGDGMEWAVWGCLGGFGVARGVDGLRRLDVLLWKGWEGVGWV